MPLKTRRMEEKSAAVRYAVKQYRARPAKEPDKQGKSGIKKELHVVKIKKQPIRRAWEKLKDYFR